MPKKTTMILLMILLTLSLVMSSIPLVHACHSKAFAEKDCLTPTHGYDSDNDEDWGVTKAESKAEVGCKTLTSEDTYAKAWALDRWLKKDKLSATARCDGILLPGKYAYAKAETDKEKDTSAGSTTLSLEEDIVIMQIGVGWANYSIDAYDYTAGESLFSAVATFENGVFNVIGDWSILDWLVQGPLRRYPARTFATVPDDHEYHCAHACEANASYGTAEARSGLPPSVGGVLVPVDKLGLLAPYIGLASTILVATTVATVIYAKHAKRRKEKQ